MNGVIASNRTQLELNLGYLWLEVAGSAPLGQAAGIEEKAQRSGLEESAGFTWPSLTLYKLLPLSEPHFLLGNKAAL